MPGLFAADLGAGFDKLFEDVFVSYIGSYEINVFGLKRDLEADVAHYGCHNCRVSEFAVALQKIRHYPQRGVAIDDLAAFIDKQCTVSVAIKSHAEIRTCCDDLSLQMFEMQRTAILIDISPVRLVVNGDDIGPDTLK